VRHIAHRLEIPRSEIIDTFEGMIAQWLREVYSAPLMKTQTHTGYINISSGDKSSPSEQGHDKTPSLPRTQSASTEPLLELEAKPFLERSGLYLRLKAPLPYGRGYGARSQPFKAQDIQCWQRIRDYDWSLIVGSGTDVLAFINHWFECDFTWEVLEQIFQLDQSSDSFDAIAAGDAKAGHAVSNMVLDGPSVKIEWTCQVCTDEGEPTVNTVTVPAHNSRSDDAIGPFSHDFCISCRTYRYDPDIWLCMGPPKNSWPRGATITPCCRAIQMRKPSIGVPCCPACETVRHKFQEDEVFQTFSNSVKDEPVPKRTLRV
jgi:hypothetical protein